jgi:putative flippase GtrA
MLAQLLRFIGIGGLATLAHVLTALIAETLFPLTAQQANLAGFAAGFATSYAGHARVTFGAPLRAGGQFLRFAVLSLLGLAASSGTVWLVTARLGFGFPVAMAAVALVVPALSYLAMRFWVFAGTGEKTPP